MDMTYQYDTIEDLSKLLREQKVSPVEVVAQCLERINTLQPRVNAFITITADQAMADAKKAAEEIKAGKWRGPLHGIPVALKDMYDTEGVKTTAAFVHFRNRVPKKDAPIVTRLKEAGAIIVGKTNMHTLAMGTTSLESYFGPVHNPWNKEYIAGGSSGGSTAAVATGMCYATIDTDAIGSCRLPAACCGVVGYKCSWGLLDNRGILEGEQAPDPIILKLATAAITTRSAMDTAIVADVLTGQDFTRTVMQENAKPRVGIVRNLHADQSVKESFDAAIKVFEKLGYDLVEVAAPINEQPDMSKIDQSRESAKDTLFKGIDVMILPTTVSSVPKASSVGQDPQALSPQYTFLANYLALPAVSVPCGFDEAGLPLGLQVVGTQHADDIVLQVAAAYQRNTSWSAKHPQ